MSMRHDHDMRLARQASEDAYYAQQWVREAEVREDREELEWLQTTQQLPRIPVRPELWRMLGHFSQAQQDQWIDDMQARYGEGWD